MEVLDAVPASGDVDAQPVLAMNAIAIRILKVIGGKLPVCWGGLEDDAGHQSTWNDLYKHHESQSPVI